MAHVTYHIVEHDGGWAYTVDGVYSEAFPTHEAARFAAGRAAAEQRAPGDTAAISWEDAGGKWHEEVAEGHDRPETEVDD
jgi:hypothetical protein